MSAFVKEQPKHGERVLLCGHETDRMHWLTFSPLRRFRRPDGTQGEAKWLVCCNDCFVRYADDFSKIPVRDDGIWNGDGPVITKPS
jgi:hypothetical protein